MITGNERLIIVLGMPHSGTTVLTYVIKQHPEILCGASGNEAWILENDWLPSEQTAAIATLLADHPGHRILSKRPWNCVWHRDWMVREMPNARFIYCYRDVEEIARSWSKPESFVEEQIRNGGTKSQYDFYRFCRARAATFGKRVPYFFEVYHPEFVRNPDRLLANFVEWAGLGGFKFDTSNVGFDNDIKRLMWSQQANGTVSVGNVPDGSVPDSDEKCTMRDFEQAGAASLIAGRYIYRRIWHDERPMELKGDGTIGEGAGDYEMYWRVCSVDGIASLEIHSEAGVIAICQQDCDGVWRGRWNQFEQIPIELVPESDTAMDDQGEDTATVRGTSPANS